MGSVWGGALDEAGHPYSALGDDAFIEAGVGQVSFAYLASDSKLSGSGFGMSFSSIVPVEITNNLIRIL